MGMESVHSFVMTWTAMTAAMMAPSALPFVISFARRSRRWLLPTLALVAVYLLVWAVFGVAVYYASRDISMPWASGVTAGVALAFVGVYALMPLKRTGQARCIAMCRRRELLDSGALRAALAEGMTYGLSCVACRLDFVVRVVVCTRYGPPEVPRAHESGRLPQVRAS